jgi:GH24 family phage-related lysozyme (muramidase)
MTIWDRKSVPALAKPGLRLFEADRLAAYRDGGGIWTEGTGSTVDPAGKPVKASDHVTQAQDDAMLDRQLLTIRIPAILRAIPASVPLTDAMAAMLCSLDYNEGVGVLDPGNVITEMLAAGLIERGFAQGMGWCVATQNGVRGPSLGILRRRRVENLVAFGGDLHASYDAVWKLGMSDLLPLYTAACTDAAAYRHGVVTWEVHTVAAVKPAPVSKPAAPIPTTSTAGQDEADLLDQQFNPGATT